MLETFFAAFVSSPAYIFIYLCSNLFTSLSIHLSVYLSTYLSIILCIYLCTYLYLPVYQSVFICIYLCTYLYLPFHCQSVCLYMYLSMYLFHINQLAQARRVFTQYARGPAFDKYMCQLEESCTAFWTNGHQQCEAVSLSRNPCGNQV